MHSITQNEVSGMKRELKNQDVRNALKDAGMYQYELAYALGISDVSLNKWLRHELSDEKKDRIFQIIEEWKKDNRE